MFCDELKIKIVAGKGGDGCASFRREKYVPKGGPDGGNGGHGGSVFLKVNTNLNTLSHLLNNRKYKADDGVRGQSQNKYGKNAEDLTIEVPQGTTVYNEDKSEILADLNKEGEEFVIAKGGKGGLGNRMFVSSTHQAPTFAETGEPGETKDIVLELKLVADVGLIGLPSAGKSTIISVISNAKPKIADYHFTTLIPNLGVVNMSKFGGSVQDSFVAADIPGLIEGASKGKGLGHKFLKHVTRTKLLVHVIDGYLENIEENYKTINKELKQFNKELAKKDQILVINKIDLLSEEELSKKVEELEKSSKKAKIFLISALTKEGIKELAFEIFKKLTSIKKKEKLSPRKEDHIIPTLRPHLETVKFEIDKIIKKKDHKIFRIIGKRIEQLIVMTDINNIEGLERMYHYIERLGIKRAIESKGAEIGDMIKIKEKYIPYRR